MIEKFNGQSRALQLVFFFYKTVWKCVKSNQISVNWLPPVNFQNCSKTTKWAWKCSNNMFKNNLISFIQLQSLEVLQLTQIPKLDTTVILKNNCLVIIIWRLRIGTLNIKWKLYIVLAVTIQLIETFLYETIISIINFINY